MLTEPKIEAWTSKFIKNSIAAPPTLAVDVPKEVPFIEILPVALPATVAKESDLSKAAANTDKQTKLTASSPKLEFIHPPPATVTRRAPRKELPPEYVESPLTRAKRIDAQNTWREAQLRNFLGTRADQVKTALLNINGLAHNEHKKVDHKVSKKAQQLEAAIIHEPAVTSVMDNLDTDNGDTEKPIELESCKEDSKLFPVESNEKPIRDPKSPLVDQKLFEQVSVEEFFVSDEQLPKIDDSVFDFESVMEPVNKHRGDASLTDRGSNLNNTITSSIPVLQTKSSVLIDPFELERRRRLKERNEKAVEKKKMLLQKAQQIRTHNTALPAPISAPLSRPVKKLPAVASVNKHTLSQLQKKAVINSASKDEHETRSKNPATMTQNDDVKTEKIFKKPLPKVKTPSKFSSIDDNPSSDDTFTVAANSKPTLLKDSELSPKLPHISSE